MSLLPLGFSETPPCHPWGINFGGGVNSTAVIIECRKRGFTPNWILFADTGSERPETLEHVARMQVWCKPWAEVTVVRWVRKEGELAGQHEPLHETCLRRSELPSKSYGYAGCTSKWKIHPMDEWRKERGFMTGAFAVGYDTDEKRRIGKACARGDQPEFTAWYPLVAWGINRADCSRICIEAGIGDIPKSSCFMCPNMKPAEWRDLRAKHPKLMDIALEIERKAMAAGNARQGGLIRDSLDAWNFIDANQQNFLTGANLEDRCHHGGCFT